MKRGSALAFVVYALLAVVYTHPLLMRATEQIANDRFDPVLNASILWWNATTIPFTPAWWTPPHYYPSRDVAAFTENLVGLLPINGPMQWLTNDAILTYNLTFFLTWPLSGLTAFVLARRVCRRSDAAFIAGLVFAFAPYRISQMGHLQVLACFWFPLALLALHAYVEERRARWLVLFGAAWLLQSWTNGYFMLFGGLIIAGWILYFCTTAGRRHLIAPMAAAWILSSVPVLATLLKYRAVHEAYGLDRPYDAIVAFSAQPAAWGHVSNLAVFWPRWLMDVDPETNLFPGLTAVVLVVVAGIVSVLAARATASDDRGWRVVTARLAGLSAVIFTAVVAVTLVLGPWRAPVPGLAIRSSTIDRPLLMATLAMLVYLVMSARARRVLATRPPFVFYTLAVVVVVVLSMGPEIRSGRSVLLENAPYSWLLWLPGFNGLRVPPRFWMLGMLCLAVAAGLAFTRLVPRARTARLGLFLLVSAGVLLDGWLREMPTGNPPERWTRVEPRNRDRALLELPLGPDFDAAATFRAVGHGRRVVNGVSGYDPPHYGPLQTALNEKDVSLLTALGSLGPIDVVVDTRAEGEWERYVGAVPGVKQLHHDGERVLFELPAPAPARAEGALLRTERLADRQQDAPSVDLGASRQVGSLVLVADGRREGLRGNILVEISEDDVAWSEVWRGSTMGLIVVSEMRDPYGSGIMIPINAPARWIRVRRLGSTGSWPLAEIRVHAPAGA
jgi:hypothetical protein